jgi:hypothetical protein
MNRRHFFVRISAALGAHSVLPEPDAADIVPSRLHKIIDAYPLAMPPRVEIPAWLMHWRSLPRCPVWESAKPVESLLIAATMRSMPVSLVYHAGTTPGQVRTFTPSLLFRTADSDEAPLYISGWCHHREAHRTLRVDQITLKAAPISTLKLGAAHSSPT